MTSVLDAPARRLTSPVRRRELLPWLVAPAMYLLVEYQGGLWWPLVENAVPALVALAVVVVASRRPDWCLVALFAFMPYQVFAPAWLYANGVPTWVIRPLTAWREALGLAILLAAIRAARASKRSLTNVDRVAIAYVVLVAAYAMFPTLFAEDAPTDGDLRSQAFRITAGFVLLLLACRHALIGGRGRDLADRALRWTAVVVAVGAVWEFVDGDAWNRFAVETVQVTRYQIDVLDADVFNPEDVRVLVELGGREFVRVSSVMGSPLTLGHFLLIPFGLAMERALRGRTPGATAQAALFGAAILFTQTRSALLGAAIVIATVMRRSRGRSPHARSRFWLVLVGVVVAAAPFAIGANLFDRFGDNESNVAHEEGFFEGVQSVGDDPLGHGLGTSAGVGQRFGTVRSSLAENYYLQIGNEMGVIGIVGIVAVVVATNRALRRARDETGDAIAAGARSGFLALSVAAFFLHAFNNQTVSWSAFGLAGLALAASLPARPADQAEPGGSATLMTTSTGRT